MVSTRLQFFYSSLVSTLSIERNDWNLRNPIPPRTCRGVQHVHVYRRPMKYQAGRIPDCFVPGIVQYCSSNLPVCRLLSSPGRPSSRYSERIPSINHHCFIVFVKSAQSSMIFCRPFDLGLLIESIGDPHFRIPCPLCLTTLITRATAARLSHTLPLL